MSTRTPSAQLVAPQGDPGNAQRVQVQNDWGWYAYDTSSIGVAGPNYAGRTYETGQNNLPNAPGNPLNADNTRFAELEAGDIAFTYDPAPAANQGGQYGKWVCIYKGTQNVGNAAGDRALWARMDNQAGSTVVQTIRDAHAIVVGIDAARAATLNAVGQSIEPDVAGETCDWIDPGDGTQLVVALGAAGAMGGAGVDLRIRPGDIVRVAGGPFVVPSGVRVIGAQGNNGALITSVGVDAPATDARVFLLSPGATLENLTADSRLATHVGPATGVVDGATNPNCTLRNVRVNYSQVAGALPAGVFTTAPLDWELNNVRLQGQFSTSAAATSIGVFFNPPTLGGGFNGRALLRDVVIISFDTGLRSYSPKIDSYGLFVVASQFGVRVGRSGGAPLTGIDDDYATFVDTQVRLTTPLADFSGDDRVGVWIEGRALPGAPGAELGGVLNPSFHVLQIEDFVSPADETEWQLIRISAPTNSGNNGTVRRPKLSKVTARGWHRTGIRCDVQTSINNGDFDQILVAGSGFNGTPTDNIAMDWNLRGTLALRGSSFRALTVTDMIAQTAASVAIRFTGTGHNVTDVLALQDPTSTAGRAVQFGKSSNPTGVAVNIRAKGVQARGFNFGVYFDTNASRCALADGYAEALGATAADFAISLQANAAADHSIHDNALFAAFGAVNIIENLGSVGTNSHDNITLASATA